LFSTAWNPGSLNVTAGAAMVIEYGEPFVNVINNGVELLPTCTVPKLAIGEGVTPIGTIWIAGYWRC
jgi:hypothetical protein